MDRVKGLIVDPTDSAIQAAFSPMFLSQIPPDKVKDVFTRTKFGVGVCKDQQVVTVDSVTSADLRLSCERGATTVSIVVNADAPHLIERLLLKPVVPR